MVAFAYFYQRISFASKKQWPFVFGGFSGGKPTGKRPSPQTPATTSGAVPAKQCSGEGFGGGSGVWDVNDGCFE